MKKRSDCSVGILSLPKSYNFGAFLQAYALQKSILATRSCVEFLNIYDWRENYKLAKTLLRPKKKNVSSIAFNIRKYFLFKCAQKHLGISNKLYFTRRKHYATIIVGSDEVWNIKNPTYKAIPEFYGIGLNTERLVSYAPGAAETNLQDIEKNAYIAEGLKRFSSISVRDANAEEIARCFATTEPVRVLDPTFLVNYDEEIVACEHEKFILIYSYNMPAECREEILNFAHKRSLETISVGFYSDWCDISINASPFEFLGFVKAADYVITDTFHGTMFSVIFNKEFAVYTNAKMKIMDFLDRFGFSQRAVSAERSLEQIFEQPVNLINRQELQNHILLSKQFLTGILSK